MTFAKNLYADLLEKRLWPLALALLVALVAFPILLSSSPKEKASQTAPPPSNSLLGRGASALLNETQPVVSVAPQASSKRKPIARLARKNPFVQQARPHATGSGGLNLPTTSTSTGTTGGGGTTNPSTFMGGPSAPGTGNAGPQTTTRPVQYQYTADVKFGEIRKTATKTVKVGDSLPNDENPVVLFLGAADEGKTGLFLVAPGVTPTGDGECKPTKSNCFILHMKKGDVEFFEVGSSIETVKTYELKLSGIGKREVSSSAKQSRHAGGRHRTRKVSSSARRSRHAGSSKVDRPAFGFSDSFAGAIAPGS
jgi:hypothetical protein